jgi:PilZ domain
MVNQIGSNDQRGQPRVSLEFPATITFGSQITLKGQLKDLSLNSALIRIKNSIYLNINDEIGFTIDCSSNDAAVQIQGSARISRIIPGEGFAIYFTKIDDDSLKYIKKALQKAGL